MIGIDTNVLLRVLVEDDAGQVERVRALFSGCRARQEPVYISLVVLAETVWALHALYGYSAARVVAAVTELLDVDVVQFEAEHAVRAAIGSSSGRKQDFVDYLIGQANLAAGCRTSFTFDRRLRGAAGFTIL